MSLMKIICNEAQCKDDDEVGIKTIPDEVTPAPDREDEGSLQQQKEECAIFLAYMCYIQCQVESTLASGLDDDVGPSNNTGP